MVNIAMTYYLLQWESYLTHDNKWDRGYRHQQEKANDEEKSEPRHRVPPGYMDGGGVGQAANAHFP